MKETIRAAWRFTAALAGLAVRRPAHASAGKRAAAERPQALRRAGRGVCRPSPVQKVKRRPGRQRCVAAVQRGGGGRTARPAPGLYLALAHAAWRRAPTRTRRSCCASACAVPRLRSTRTYPRQSPARPRRLALRRRRSHDRVRALADRAGAVPRIEAGRRSRGGRAAHASQRLPDRLGAHRLLRRARRPSAQRINTSTWAVSPSATVKSRLKARVPDLAMIV